MQIQQVYKTNIASAAEMQPSLGHLRPRILRHIFAPKGVDGSYIAVEHTIIIAIDLTAVDRHSAAASDQDVGLTDIIQSRAQIGSEISQIMLGVSQIVGVFPQNRDDLLGGAGCSVSVDKVREQFFGSAALEDKRLIL